MDWAAFATTYMQNSTYTNDANDIIYSSIISLALAIQMMMSFFFFSGSIMQQSVGCSVK